MDVLRFALVSEQFLDPTIRPDGSTALTFDRGRGFAFSCRLIKVAVQMELGHNGKAEQSLAIVAIILGVPPALPGWQQKFDISGSRASRVHR